MLGWFARRLGPRWPTLLVATISMVAAAATDMAPPLLMRYLIDDVFIAHKLGRLTYLMTAAAGRLRRAPPSSTACA